MVHIEDIVFKLKKSKKIGPAEWKGCCPAHDDNDPSLCVGSGDKGIVLNCLTGCRPEDVAGALGYKMSDLFYETAKPGSSYQASPPEKVTIKKMADKTGLPVQYLEDEIGLEEKGSEVLVPYWDERGKHLYDKKRVKLEGKDKYLYKAGTKAQLYGLWNLDEALGRKKRYLFLPEGETDCWTFWYHNISAIGIPGASTYRVIKIENVKDFDRLYIVQEKGNAGAEFAINVGKQLKKIGYEGDIYVVRCPEDAKDPNELYKKFPERFVELMKQAVAEAKFWTGDDLDDVVIRMSDVKAEKVNFLWAPYFPLGMVTLLAGKPGLGKSLLTTWLTGIITTGGMFPEATEPMGVTHNVILIAAEDDLGTVLKVRLDAVGADSERVYAYDLDKYDFSLKDPASFDKLDRLIVKHKPIMIVIDPLISFVDGKVDINKANEVRELIKPLAVIARIRQVAMVVVAHVKKGNVSAAIDAVMGSLDFVAAARSAVIVTPDPDNPQTGRVLSHAKHNVTSPGPSLRFEITGEINKPQFEWKGVSKLSADELALVNLKPEERILIDDAERFLKEELSDGPRLVDDFSRYAKKLGIKKQALNIARDRMNVIIELINGDWYYVWSTFPQEKKEERAEQEAPY
jgi:putative DNA primase/helicase